MKISSKLIKNLPQGPGIYLYKNTKGDVIYVGKAKNLRARVRSYFNPTGDHTPKTSHLVQNIDSLDYVLTDSETEALMLENSYIKKYQPHYNILLKDDKNYQFIKIDYTGLIPQIYTVRKIGKRGKDAHYFGPYSSGRSVRESLRLARYIFGYCGNDKPGLRPCFYHHLGRCPGICNGKITRTEYEQHLKKIEKFFSGQMRDTLQSLKKEMKEAAGKKLFERAARLRDQAGSLSTMLEKQKIVSAKKEDFDTVSVFLAGSLSAVHIFQIREGRIFGNQNFILDNAKNQNPAEILRAFAERYYLETSDLPKEIVLQQNIEGGELLEKLLKQISNKSIKVSSPSRGRKRQLVKMGVLNAKEYLQSISRNLAREQAVLTRALFELKDKLKLPDIPLRVECYDISNTQGTSPTGSMVVFENGKPKKSSYKRFAIRSLQTPNDIAMMTEMLTRRFAHEDPGDATWKIPDLIIVDGGRSQLNAAIKVLNSRGFKIPIFGLAKKLEEIYRPNFQVTLRLPSNSPALQLLQRLRDEAHRFAVTYHRKRRSKKLLEDQRIE